jgi:threonine-phosphate decarboxylase
MKKPVHGGNLAEIAEKMGGVDPNEILDFSVNVNPFPFRGLECQVSKAIEKIGRYPDNRYASFRRAAAEYLGVLPENTIPGNGSTELIKLFLEAFAEKGDTVLVPKPTYGEYEYNCRILGARVKFAEYGNVTKMKELDGVKILFLCNPNNPTGDLLSKKEVLKLAGLCERYDTFFFIDEVFIELSDPEQSIAKIAAKSDNIFVLRSLTKCFAVPGLRVGYGVSSEKNIEKMDAIRSPWNVNCIAEEAAIYCFRNGEEYLKRSRETIKKERAQLVRQLKEVPGIEVKDSAVNFILIKCGRDAQTIAGKLLEQNILVRDCSSFGLKNHIRVAVKTKEENEKLVEAMKKVLG